MTAEVTDYRRKLRSVEDGKAVGVKAEAVTKAGTGETAGTIDSRKLK